MCLRAVDKPADAAFFKSWATALETATNAWVKALQGAEDWTVTKATVVPTAIRETENCDRSKNDMELAYSLTKETPCETGHLLR